MKRVLTRTTYLEMFSPPARTLAAPRKDVEILRVHSPSVQYYRYLYRSVGRPYQWIDRALLADHELAQIVQDDRVEIYLLEVAGQPAGYCELDRRQPGEIELAYFGLFPGFLGQGLGKYFLWWALDRAWSYGPRRVWVHTCDLDHEAALPNYLKAGFTIYDVRMTEQVVTDEQEHGEKES
mgnify:CR=1 FL=1